MASHLRKLSISEPELELAIVDLENFEGDDQHYLNSFAKHLSIIFKSTFRQHAICLFREGRWKAKKQRP